MPRRSREDADLDGATDVRWLRIELAWNATARDSLKRVARHAPRTSRSAVTPMEKRANANRVDPAPPEDSP